MVQASAKATHSSVRGELPSFVRHLRAENKAPATIETYLKACEQFADFVEATGRSAKGLSGLRRDDVESWIVDLQERGAKPATASQRYRSLQAFWKWLVSEGEVADSPMAKMRPPFAPVEPPEIIQADDLKKLLA